MTGRRIAGALGAALLWAGTAQAAPAPEPTATLSVAAAAASRLRPRATTETTLVSRQGRAYRILVSAPQGPAPEGGFPVIYVLDGDAWFATAVEVARVREWSRLPPAVIVGVGYPGAVFFDAARRSYDFTAPGAKDPDFDGVALGGADEFLGFLNDELKPWVASNQRVDPARQALFGHSMGALFVLHAVFKAPASFSAYVAASPPMRFSGGAIGKEAAAFEAGPPPGGARLLVTVGGLESHPSPALMDDYRRWYTAHPEAIPGQTADQAVAELFRDDPAYDKAADIRALVERLALHGLKASFVEFSGEEHTASAVDALNRAVPFALRPAGGE